MPNVIATVSNLEASVERPVIFDIIRQVMDITQISSRTPVRFYGDEGKGPQKNSLLGSDGPGENRWNYDDKLVIEVEEDYERNRFLSTAVKEAENQFIFRDSALQTAVKPVYASTEVTVNFRYRARDKNQANRWRNEIRARCSMMRGVNIHALTYHYQFPLKLMMVLGEIHRLREEVAGYGDDFNTYLAQHLTTKAQLVGGMDGRHVNWTIGETQGRVQGYFEFEGIPDKSEKDGDHDAYTTTFAYKFCYDKPIECAMQYPLVIHQQLLDTNWRPAERAFKVTDVLKTYSSSALAFSKFESEREKLETEANEGVDLPHFDEFLPGSIVPGTLRIMTALSCISEEDKRSLYKLDDLGEEFAMDRDVLEFIAQSEAPFMGRPYHSILHMSLYENQFLRGPDSVIVNPDLSVVAAKDLSLRTVHRTRLSMVADLSLLTPDAKDRLKDWPKAGEKILTAINAGLSNKGGQKDLGGNKIDHDALCKLGFHYHTDSPSYVRSALPGEPGSRRLYYIKAGPCACGGADGLPIRKSKCYDGTNIRFNLVQTLFVAARRMNQFPNDKSDVVFGATN